MTKTEERRGERRASEVREFSAGDRLLRASGVRMEIQKVTVGGLQMVHQYGRGPTVTVTYAYDDNGLKGVETVSIENFLDNLHS